MKKIFLSLIFTAILSFGFSQTFAEGDCQNATGGCDIPDFVLTGSNPLGTGNNLFNDLPAGNNISNPSTNPGTAGNSGCLFSNELNPVWMVFTVTQPGQLEFTIGGPGSTGFFDWALWPYYSNPATGTSACDDITNNTLPPAACNWNGSASGWTGMVAPGNLPAGANASNFENSITVQAGDQFVLCFSNYSSVGSTANPVPVPVATGPNIPGTNNTNSTAIIDCSGGTFGYDVCLGDTLDFTVDETIYSFVPQYQVLNNVSEVDNPTAGPGFVFTPLDTVEYLIQISDNGVPQDTVTVIANVAFPTEPNAGVDVTACIGDVVPVTGNLGQPNHSFSWAITGPGFAALTPLTSLSPTAFTNTLGTYTIALTESNGICPDSTHSIQVTWEDPVITTSKIDPSCGLALDGSIEITAIPGAQYSFDNGVTWQASNNMSGLGAGTYDVCVETAVGCQKCTQVTLVDPIPVVISVSNDTTICLNGSATLVASATGGTSYTFQWSHTSDLNGTQIVNPLVNTNYTVQAFNEFNCSSLIAAIDVTLLGDITGTISPDITICPGYSTMLTATGADGDGGPYTYEWSANGSSVSTDQTFTVNPSSDTQYSVTISDGCETSPLTLTMNVLMAPLPNVLMSVDQQVDCEPGQFVFSNDTDPALVASTYWNLSNDSSYFNMNILPAVIQYPGVYDMQLVVVTPDGCIDSATVNGVVEVLPVPNADFAYSAPVTMFNTEVLLTNYSDFADTYVWSAPNGTPSFSVTDNMTTTFPDAQTGDYPVTLIAYSQFGCTDTITKIVTVVPEVIFYAPNSFTPDNDEFNQTWSIHIEGIDEYDFDLFIYNRWGEMIWESHDINAKWDGTYNGDLLPVGTYTWSVRGKNLIDDGKFERTGHVNIIR
ncbi:MAG: gliding motility-associated C-terminal domain-containing protein [Lishizhenia sp.]